MTLTEEKRQKVERLKADLPPNWVKLMLAEYEEKFGIRFTRQNAYHILGSCKDSHPGWKILEAIAAKYQKTLSEIAHEN